MTSHLNFKSVSYQNFLATGNKPITIALDTNPTTLIYGKNGSGKSTMYEALYFGLYGKAFRRSNIPELINNINNKKMLVTVEFSVGGVDFKVIRGRVPGVFEIYREGKLIDQGSSSYDYQSYLEKVILCMSSETFMQTVILGSLHYVPYMRLNKTKDRMAIIEELLDIQIFSTMWNMARTHLNSLKRELETLQGKEDLLNTSIRLVSSHIGELETKSEENRGKINDQIAQLKLDILAAKETLDGFEFDKSQIDVSNLADLEAQKEKWARFETLAKKELSELRIKEKFLDTTTECPTCTQEISEVYKERELAKTNGRVKSVSNALETTIKDTLTKTVDELSGIRDLQNSLIALNGNIISEQTKAQSLQNELDKLVASLTTQSDKEHLSEKKKELGVFKANLTKLMSKRQEMQKDADEYEFVARLLNDDGIKKNIIKMYIPVINKLISKYLSILGFPIKFTFDENFKESIIVKGRRDLTYSSFSAGEKMRVDLALLFAFREIPIIRSGNSCNLLIFDEVADSALDIEGWDSFFTIIDSISDVGNVFVISPRGDVLVDKFTKALVFKKSGPFSVLENVE